MIHTSEETHLSGWRSCQEGWREIGRDQLNAVFWSAKVWPSHGSEALVAIFFPPFLSLGKGKLKRKSEISQHQQLGSSPKRKKIKAQVLNPIHMHPAKLPQPTRFPLASHAKGDAIWKKSIRAHAPRRCRHRRRSGQESGLQDALPQCTFIATIGARVNNGSTAWRPSS